MANNEMGPMDFSLEDLMDKGAEEGAGSFADIEVPAEDAETLDKMNPDMLASYLASKGYNVAPAQPAPEEAEEEMGEEMPDEDFEMDFDLGE